MTIGTETRDRPLAVLVNDDVTQLRMLNGLLTNEGLAVGAFTGAEEALDAMARREPPDLIITDLYMPGIDGWRFCRLLRSPEHPELNGVPVLVISATFSGEEAARITADLGANAFLPSPVDGRRFIALVRELLAGNQPQGFLRALVIDDDGPLAFMLKAAFEGHGYRVEKAPTLGGARDRFRAGAFDTAVIDYHLPDGEGDTLLAEFRRSRPECVCIMMTADASPDLALRWMKMGAAAYLRKPFEPEYLVELCARARRERALLRVEDLLEQRTRELRENERRYRLLFSALDAGMALNEIIRDGSGRPVDYRFLEVNPAFEKLTGMPAESLVGRSALETLPNLEPAWIDRFGKVALTGESIHFDRRCEVLDRDFAVTAYSPQRGRFVTLFTDITDRKRAEAKRLEMERRLQQARKAESLGRMAGAIAHNFNNLLGAVMGNLELALDDLPDGEKLGGRLDQAMAATRRAAEISRMMLAYQGQITGKREPRDLAGICVETLPVAISTLPDTVRVETEFPRDGPTVLADAARVGQVLAHLVENAGEAVGSARETVRISVGTIRAKSLSGGHLFPVGWRPQDDEYACLEVADTGCGVDEAQIEQLFDPYFTTKFTGRGLGLAVVLGTVTAHGGALSVESRPGEGTTFRVLLPLHRGPIHGRTDAAGPAEPRFEAGGTVLLVEDQAMVRRVAEAMLQRAGFTVLAVESGEEAVEVFRRKGKKIQLALCDLTMPGLNGWETMAALKEIRPDLPVILSSGYDESQVISGQTSSRPDAFLAKPYRREDLQEAISGALRSRTGRTRTRASTST